MTRPLVNGVYSIPPEILALRPEEIPCTVKKIPSSSKVLGQTYHYYVYETVTVDDRKNPGQTKKSNSSVIGKIEGGKFIPNKRGIQRLKEVHNDCTSDVTLEKNIEPVKNEPVLTSVEAETVKKTAINMNVSQKSLELQSKDYGEYAAVLACTDSVLERLEKIFSDEDARLLYALSIIHFIQEYTPASYINDVYDQSILSNKWPTLPISENHVGEFLRVIGRHPATIEQYCQMVINESSRKTAIDGHVILTCSRQNDLADYGNKYPKIGNKQLNILEAYDVVNEIPLTSTAFEGGTPDKSSVRDLFDAYVFPSGTCFMIDMGFYTEEDMKLYRENDNFFIIPVPENTIISRAMRHSITFTDSFIYEKTNEDGEVKRNPILYRESTVKELEDLYQMELDIKAEREFEENINQNKSGETLKKNCEKKVKRSDFPNDRIVMYRDTEMHDKMMKEYRSQIGMDKEHTEERLKELSQQFGIIILRFNLPTDIPASQAYYDYKLRWKIETHYNFVENTIKFCGFQLDDYYGIQGLSFLIVIFGQIKKEYQKKKNASSLPYVKNMSIRESLVKARYLKISQHVNQKWYVPMVSSSHNKVVKEMGVDIARDIESLNKNTY